MDPNELNTIHNNINNRINFGYQQIENYLKKLTPEQLNSQLTIKSKIDGQTTILTVRQFLDSVLVFLNMFSGLNAHFKVMNNQALQQINIVKGLANDLANNVDDPAFSEALSKELNKMSKTEPFRYRQQIASPSGRLGTVNDSPLTDVVSVNGSNASAEQIADQANDLFAGIENVPHVGVYDAIMSIDRCADFGLFDVCISDIVPLDEIAWLLDTVINGLITYVVQPIWSGMLYVAKKIKEAYDWVVDQLKWLGRQIKSFFETIPNALRSGYETVIGGIMYVVNNIVSAMTEIINFINSAADLIFTGLQKIIYNFKLVYENLKIVFTIAWNFFTKDAPAIIRRLWNLGYHIIVDITIAFAIHVWNSLKQVVLYILDVMYDIFEIIKDKLIMLGGIMVDGFNNVKETSLYIADQVSTGFDTVTTNLNQTLGSVIQNGQDNINNVINYISDSADYGFTGFKNVFSMMPGELTESVNVLKSGFDTFVNDTTNSSKQLTETVDKTITNTINSSKTIAESSINGLSQSFNSGITDLSNNFNKNISPSFQQSINKVGDTVNSTIGLVKQSGQDVVNGINSNINNVYNNKLTQINDGLQYVISSAQKGIDGIRNTLSTTVNEEISKSLNQFKNLGVIAQDEIDKSIGLVKSDINNKIVTPFTTNISNLNNWFQSTGPAIIGNALTDGGEQLKQKLFIVGGKVKDRTIGSINELVSGAENGMEKLQSGVVQYANQIPEAFYTVWDPVMEFSNTFVSYSWNILTFLSKHQDKLSSLKYYFWIFVGFIVFVKFADWYVGHLGYQFDMFGNAYKSL